MFEFNDTNERELMLNESIKELECINKKLAKLMLRKEELTDSIIACFGHEHDGQKTYEYETWKVEIKTPCTYLVNKELLRSGLYELPAEYNPIKQSISYTVDKKLCDEYLLSAPREVRALLVDLIEKKPGKPSVTIKERI
jgi:hypothetical protein